MTLDEARNHETTERATHATLIVFLLDRSKLVMIVSHHHIRTKLVQNYANTHLKYVRFSDEARQPEFSTSFQSFNEAIRENYVASYVSHNRNKISLCYMYTLNNPRNFLIKDIRSTFVRFSWTATITLPRRPEDVEKTFHDSGTEASIEPRHKNYRVSR